MSFYLFFASITQISKYPGYYSWKKGVDHSAKLEWEASILDLNKALEQLPQKGELLYNLGASHIFNDEYSRGLFYLKESEKYFNDRNIYLSGAYALMKLGDLKEAEASAIKALKMFPTHLAPHLMLGEIYFYQGRFEQSKVSLLKCMNEEIEIKSVETKQISKDAKDLYNKFYKKR